MSLNLHRGKVIIRDCGSILQVIQGLELWDLDALRILLSVKVAEESIPIEPTETSPL